MYLVAALCDVDSTVMPVGRGQAGKTNTHGKGEGNEKAGKH